MAGSALDMLKITDSAGVSVSRYTVHFESGGMSLSGIIKGLSGFLTALVYACFLWGAAFGVFLLSIVLDQQNWMQPLADGYERLMSPIYAFAPPWIIATATFAILIVSLFFSAYSSTGSGFDKQGFDRVVMAFAMFLVVMVVAMNPVKLMIQLLSFVSKTTNETAGSINSAGSEITSSTVLADNAIRSPTLALNYATDMSSECRAKWSQAMASGKEFVDAACLPDGQPGSADPGTFLTAIYMFIILTVPLLMLAVTAAWKYVLHVSLAVLSLVTLPWVAAAAIPKRRGFEAVSSATARVAAHSIVAIVISIVTIALPSVTTAIAMEIAGEGSPFLAVTLMGVGYFGSWYAVLRVSSNSSFLVRALKADVNTTLTKTLGAGAAARYQQYNLFAKAQSAGSGYVHDRFDSLRNSIADRIPAVKGLSKFSGLSKGAGMEAGADAPNSRGLTADEAQTVEEMNKSTQDLNLDKAPASLAPKLLLKRAVVHGAQRKTWRDAVRGAREGITADVFGFFGERFSDRVIGPRLTEGPSTDASSGLGLSTADIMELTQLNQTRDGLAQRLSQMQAVHQSAVQQEQQARASGDYSRMDLREFTVAVERSAAATSQVSSELERVAARIAELNPTGAQIPTVAAPFQSTTRDTPVAGNAFADSNLDMIASAVGATFTTNGPPPAPALPAPVAGGTYSGTSGMRIVPGPFGPAPVLHDSPIRIEKVVQESTVPDTPQTIGSTASDQAAWNDRNRRMVEEPSAVRNLAETGEVVDAPRPPFDPGVNRHPAGFHSPAPDFLAAGQQSSDLALLMLLATATGQPAVIDPSSYGAGSDLLLSSDPETRVVAARGRGFGDPV